MANDAIEVIVALVGSPEGYSRRRFRGPGRDQVQLEVAPDETLSTILERAAAELGIRGGHLPVAFHDPKSDRISNSSGTVTLVGADGRAMWLRRLDEATYRQLLDAADAGVLAGDPRRVYVDTTPGMGNGTVPDWDTIKAIWDALDFVLGAIGAATTLSQAKKRIAARLRRKARSASQAIERHSQSWEMRRGDPYALRQWLDDRVWSSADVASALGCSGPEAEAVLWSFGFEHFPSCVWRRATDEESKFMAEVEGLGYGITGASPEQVRRVLEAHARKFLESGKAPTIGWQDLEWLHPSPVAPPVPRAKGGRSRVRDWFRRLRG